jgi:hypothetical protein
MLQRRIDPTKPTNKPHVKPHTGMVLVEPVGEDKDSMWEVYYKGVKFGGFFDIGEASGRLEALISLDTSDES